MATRPDQNDTQEPKSIDPDRSAATLCLAERERTAAGTGAVFATPDAGARDCRMPLKQLYLRAERALDERGTPDATERFVTVDRPHLRAGTVSDATARGVRVALEETLSLCQSEAPNNDFDPGEPHEIQVVEGKALKRRRDLLVDSGGARIRFSRKGGILLVDRTHDVHVEDCLRIEDRRDHGTLDRFVPDPDERPRLFSFAYLKASRYETGPRHTTLLLEGRLGRRFDGYPCQLEVHGRKDRAFVELRLALENRHDDHRLRLRVLGCHRPQALQSETGLVFEDAVANGQRFVAATLLRACGRLRVGEELTDVPEAQCHGVVRHRLRLGGSSWTE
ncbi:MAG: hypothetical protein AAF196_17710 [Planctomycetota bacterium]